MTPPAEVTDFAKELTCDAVVCGHGFAGITACRELAEQGKKVILIEKQPEDTYAAVGNEFAALNAKILQERGVPHIDPIEFYQNFMKITGNEMWFGVPIEQLALLADDVELLLERRPDLKAQMDEPFDHVHVVTQHELDVQKAKGKLITKNK